MKSYLLSLLITLIWLQGCSRPSSGAIELIPDQKQTEPQFNQEVAPDKSSEPEPATVSSELSYQNVLSRVLETKCLNCHSEKGGNRGHLNLEGYQNIFNNRDRIRSQVAELKMPKKSTVPLNENQLKLILDWIDAGANEFSNRTSPTPTPTIPTPTAPAEPTLPVPTPAPTVTPEPIPQEPATPPDLANLNYAAVMKLVIEPKCLKCHNTNAKNGVELANYENLIFNQEDIKKDVTSNEMPRKDQLAPEQKKLLLDWINAGLPAQ